MFYEIGLYLFYCFYFSWKYKHEIRFVNNYIRRYLTRPRITMDIRPLIRKQIMIIYNYI